MSGRTSDEPRPRPVYSHVAATCSVTPEMYLRDHFLAVNSAALWFHSSLKNTYIGLGGEDWLFDAVTFLLRRPLISQLVTPCNSKIYVTGVVRSSNQTVHPPFHPSVRPSIYPFNTCHVGEKCLTMTDQQ